MKEENVTIGNKSVKVYSKSNKTIINNTKWSNYIRISHTATGKYGSYVVNESDWHDFPVPTSMSRRLHDVDRDAYTDLIGFTHRKRVRHDVEDFDLGFSILNDDDERRILNLISPSWIYVELTDKKTGQKSIHKMYASDKQWDIYNVWIDDNGNWAEANTQFGFSLVEE